MGGSDELCKPQGRGQVEVALAFSAARGLIDLVGMDHFTPHAMELHTTLFHRSFQLSAGDPVLSRLTPEWKGGLSAVPGVVRDPGAEGFEERGVMGGEFVRTGL